MKIENINVSNEKFTVELPRDENHGDISTNLCLVFSKNAKMKPIELASLMKPLVEKLDSIIDVCLSISEHVASSIKKHKLSFSQNHARTRHLRKHIRSKRDL